METFPSIDGMLGEHVKKFLPAFQFQLEKTHPRARNMQRMLKITTVPLEVNRLPRTDLIRLVFEAAALRVLFCLPESQHLIWQNTEKFNEVYGCIPEFGGLHGSELLKLLDFRNMMAIALQLMPAKLEHLVDLVVRIPEKYWLYNV